MLLRSMSSFISSSVLQHPFLSSSSSIFETAAATAQQDLSSYESSNQQSIFNSSSSSHHLSAPTILLALASIGFINHSRNKKTPRSERTRLNMASVSDETTITDTQARLLSIHYMTASMACLFGGYEFLRSAITALFTLRFPHRSAFPLATAVVSPVSIVALIAYTKLLHRNGPAFALKFCTILSAIIVLLSLVGSSSSSIVAMGFLFQNIYLNVICNQQWSFCDSVIPKDANSRKIFGRIAGLSCIVSTITAMAVPFLSKQRSYLLSLAALSLVGSAFFSHKAYRMAQRYGFDPGQEQQNKKTKQKTGIMDTMRLFRRVPILQSLLAEAISFQSLSTVLNIAFIQSLASDEAARSSYLGRFYACCNGVSALFQFVILPHWKLQSATLWKILPLAPLITCGIYALDVSNANAVALALFSSKVMDYAIRSVAGNMVYQPLDFDSRFVGKGELFLCRRLYLARRLTHILW